MSGEDFFASEFSGRRSFTQQSWDLVDFSSRGIVLSSSKAYEIGDSMALGLHLGPKGLMNSTRYVELEGVVVQCRKLSRLREGAYEITLLVDSLSEDAAAFLSGLSELNTDSFGVGRGWEEFRGLN